MDERDWESARAGSGVEGFEQYLTAHPEGIHASAATEAITRLRESHDWIAAVQVGTANAIADFLKSHPNGDCSRLARGYLELVTEPQDWATADLANDADAMRSYLRAHPDGAHAPYARRFLLLEESLGSEVIEVACQPEAVTQTLDQVFFGRDRPFLESYFSHAYTFERIVVDIIVQRTGCRPYVRLGDSVGICGYASPAWMAAAARSANEPPIRLPLPARPWVSLRAQVRLLCGDLIHRLREADSESAQATKRSRLEKALTAMDLDLDVGRLLRRLDDARRGITFPETIRIPIGVVDDLIQALVDPDLAMRRAAAESDVLALLCDPQGVAHSKLARTLQSITSRPSEDPLTFSPLRRESAARLVDALVAALGDDDDAVRLAAAESLGAITEVVPLGNSQSAANGLARSLIQRDLQGAAASSLNRLIALGIPPQSGVMAESMRRLLNSRVDWLDYLCADPHSSSELSDLRRSANEALIGMLEDPDPAIRRDCVSQLVDDRGSASSKEARDALQRCLGRRDLPVIAAVPTFFIREGADDSIEVIAKAMEQHGDLRMAMVLLNSGNSSLESAARAWAAAHDYQVTTEQSSRRQVKWGEGR